MKKSINFFYTINIIVKCFFILMVFGIFLPKIIDYLLYIIIISKRPASNSVLVYSLINKNRSFLFNYLKTFQILLNYFI
ncbi:MAG: hypothetical protein K0R54_1588 [Clostridiaceae bacterium]|jgi:hypothetical protein|nr:hypothetical protein [Clostridiaceae bacterium]